jgi:C-terminal peptidase prc
MTKSKFVGLLGSLFLVALAALPVRAAEASRQPYVVLVGISQYDDTQILPRPHAEADVKALYDLFTNKDYMGVDADHIRLLTGTKDAKRKGEVASRRKILEALSWAADKARADDLFLFVFIGEGAPLGERTCYFATDSTFKKRAKNAVSASEIEAALSKLKSQRFCAFLDVNFKGFDSGKLAAPDLNLTKLYRELLGKEDETGALASRVLFLANSGLKPSLDLKNHGIFAQVLLDGLKGKADGYQFDDPKAVKKKQQKKELIGNEPDGRITVEELATYLRREVAERAKKHGKTDEEKKQKAIVVEGQATDFTLTHNPEVMPTVKKRLAKIAELAKEQKISAKVANQGKDLLSRMPKLESQRVLRKAFQNLADGKLDADEFLKERARLLAKNKLSRDDARDYALAILKATRMLKAGYVKEVNQGQLVAWAINGLYSRLGEKVPAEFSERLTRAKKLREHELLRLLTDVREALGKREDLVKGKDVTYTLTPMLGHLDKHTDYISPEYLEQIAVETQGQFSGIGAHIRLNTTRDMLQIVTPIMGSPAYKAKLYAGDIITTIIREVDSQGNPLDQPEVISTKGLATDEAVKLIKGKPGTKVKLKVDREGVDHPLEFEVTRGRVEIETVLGYKRKKDDQWNFYLDEKNKIAYIRLTQFARYTYRDLKTIMRKLNRQGINGLVLDLRFNPGGLLDSAVKVSDMFIDDGVIVTIKPRREQETVYIGKHEGSYLDFPMACLINDNSASGSEIVSACLQDHGRAIIVGERSYGKGSVQTILKFEPTGGELKMTNATFWRPSNKNLNKSSTKGRDEDEWGVTPDAGFVVKTPIKEQDSLYEFQRDQEIIKRPDVKAKAKPDFKDRQLDLAVKYLHEQIQVTGKKNIAKKAG